MRHIAIFYHSPCMDGYAAMYATAKHFASLDPAPTFECIKGKYYEVETLEDVLAKLPEGCTEIWSVDFSLKRPIVEALLERGYSYHIYDHHKSALELAPLLDAGKIQGVFDLERSGATICWQELSPTNNEPLPLLYTYIQDRDLWTKLYDDVDIIHNALQHKTSNLEAFEQLMLDTEQGTNIDSLRAEGNLIESMKKKMLKTVKSGVENKGAMIIELGGHLVPAVASIPGFTSDMAEPFRDECPFLAIFTTYADTVSISLRSGNDESIDLSELAASFGGGGHPKAAGLSLSLKDFLSRIVCE